MWIAFQTLQSWHSKRPDEQGQRSCFREAKISIAGIAPINLSSAGKGKGKASKQGNRRLQATLYFLAIQMIQVSTKGKPRNPIFRDYYDRKLAEGKNAKLVLVSIARRLVNIIYGMLKNKTEYRLPSLETGEVAE